jgi:hypothetical protein
MPDWPLICECLRDRIERFGVKVYARRLGFETTGIFDGLTITTNTDYDAETCCHNLAHSLGHIAQWSLDFPRFQSLYDQLNAAKAKRHTDPEGLECALRRFRDYEEEASQYAAWLFLEIGCADALPAFHNFARADIEAIVGFHRDGIAPIWGPFFDDWNTRVARGELKVLPFEPKPIPPFTPIAIEPQEVIQEVDGNPEPVPHHPP